MAGPRSPRVLVVDDEAAIRDIVRRYLTAEGFEVAEAADGREALERLCALQPDLVVLDVLICRAWTVSRCCVACAPARTSV